MSGLQSDPCDEIEYWRDKAVRLSSSDNHVNVVTSSLELIRSVFDSGPRAETLPLKIKALSMDTINYHKCSTTMAVNPLNTEQYRSLFYGMAFSVCALLNSLNKPIKEDLRAELRVKREADHEQEESMTDILKGIRGSSYDPSSTAVSIAHMDEFTGANEQAMDTLDRMDDFPMEDSLESERNDVKVPLLLKSNASTPHKRMRPHPRLLLKSEDVKKKRVIRVSEVTRAKQKSIVSGEKPEKQNQCRVCEKPFKKPSQLEIHMRCHTGEKPYNCDKCDRVYAHNYDLIKHMRSVHATLPYACNVCGEAFEKFGGLSEHRNSANHSEDKAFKCDQCGLAYTDKYRLNDHKRNTHGALPYTCNVCGEAFERSRGLVEHRKSTNHSEDKPFKCDQCGLAYMDKYELMKHQRVSHGAHPYSCNVCGESFEKSRGLVAHRKSTDHSEDKPFKCDQCGLAYMDKYELFKHQRINHRALPYSCTVCGEAFEKHLELVGHKKVAHKNDAEVFDCNQCERSYKENGELKRHLREAHRVKPYQCILCGESFAKFGMLGEHKKEAHK